MKFLDDLGKIIADAFTPKEPNAATLAKAQDKVKAASAEIINANNGNGTTYAVRYENRDYLVTSGHATDNYYNASRGFSVGGKEYFLVLKDKKLAFAEQLALDPQGGPCSKIVGGFANNRPIGDLSILRLVSPDETGHLLGELMATPDSAARLENIFKYAPAIAPAMHDHQLTQEAILRLTEGFTLAPIPVDATQPSFHGSTPSAYSVAYFRNEPDVVASRILLAADGETLPDHTLFVGFDPKNPIVPGHSGSLLFHVSEHGKLEPLGVVTGLVDCVPEGEAVSFSEVLRGLRIVSHHGDLPTADLGKICTPAPGPNQWFSASGIIPGPIPGLAAGTGSPNHSPRPSPNNAIPLTLMRFPPKCPAH